MAIKNVGFDDEHEVFQKIVMLKLEQGSCISGL